MGLAHDFKTLLALRVALGATECLFLPAAFALIAQHHSLVTRARAMSLISIGINGGMVLGGSTAGYLAEHWGWRTAFWIFGAAGLLLALGGGRFLPRDNAPEKAAKSQPVSRPSLLPALRYLVGVRSYHALLFESMLSGMGMWIFFSWLPLFFRDSFGLSLAQAGFAGTFMLQACVLIGIAAGGWLSDRLATRAPERRLLAYGGCYLIAAPSLLLFLTEPSFGVIVAAISLFSLFRGIGQANDNPTLCEVVPGHLRSRAIGLMNACSTGAGGCGVLFAGLLKGAFGLQTIFACVAGLFVLAGVALLLAYRFAAAGDIQRARAAERAVVA
jgi:predicted MFS family arabinose efflux permease